MNLNTFDRDEEEEDFGNDCIIAIVSLRQSVGIAIYDSIKSAIYTAQFIGVSHITLSERLEVFVSS